LQSQNCERYHEIADAGAQCCSACDDGWPAASVRIPQLTVDVMNLFGEKQRLYFQFPNATFTQ
jgi:hypothetical protein